MTQPMNAPEFQARLQRLEALLVEAERNANPAAQDRTREIVQAVLELHAAGLARMVEHLAAAGPMQQTIETAVYATAPDVTGIAVEGLPAPLPAAGEPARLALPVV